jgi:hypothetical protein
VSDETAPVWHQHIVSCPRAQQLGLVGLEDAHGDECVVVVCEYVGPETDELAPGVVAWVSHGLADCSDMPAADTTCDRVNASVPFTDWRPDETDRTQAIAVQEGDGTADAQQVASGELDSPLAAQLDG